MDILLGVAEYRNPRPGLFVPTNIKIAIPRPK